MSVFFQVIPPSVLSAARLQPELLAAAGPAVYPMAVGAANAQVASRTAVVSAQRSTVDAQSVARTLVAGWTRGVVGPEVANQIASKVRGQTAAAASAQVANLQRLVGIIRSAAGGQSTARLLAIAVLRSAIQGQSASHRLASAIIRSALNAQSAARGAFLVSVIRGATDAQVAARTLVVAMVRSAVDAEIAGRALLVSIIRGAAASGQSSARTLLVSIIRHATDAQAVANSTRITRAQVLSAIDAQIAALVPTFIHAGQNFGQAAATFSAEVANLLKQTAKLISGVDAQAAGDQRAVGISRTTTDGQSVSRRLGVAIVRTSVGAQATARLLLVSVIRGVVDAQVVARNASLSISRVATSAQSAALIKRALITRATASAQLAARLLNVAIRRAAFGAQVANIVPEFLGFVFPQSAPASEGQSAHLQRQVGWIRSSASAQAALLIRLVAVLRAIAAAQVVARVLAVTKRVGAVSAEVSASVRSFPRLINLASGEAAALSRSTGRVASAINATIALLLKATAARRSATSSQAPSRGAVTVGKLLPAGPFEVTALGLMLTRGKAVATASAQAAALVVAHISTHTYALLLSVLSPSFAASARGRTLPPLHTVSAAAASMSTWLHQFVPLRFRRRVTRLPGPQQAATLPPATRKVTLPSQELVVALPPSVRRVVVPREEDELSDYEIVHPEPAFFSPLDPTDQDVFTFDWSVRGYPNDTIVFASVVSVPLGVQFVGPAFINGSVVEITVGPFTTVPPTPTTYALRCMAVFASGRISNFSVPFIVKTL